jgi:hypothetical protein
MIPGAASSACKEKFPSEPEDLFWVMADDISYLNGR